MKSIVQCPAFLHFTKKGGVSMGHFFISVGGLYLLLGLEAAAKVVGMFIR
jgi:hypothetical protein